MFLGCRCYEPKHQCYGQHVRCHRLSFTILAFGFLPSFSIHLYNRECHEYLCVAHGQAFSMHHHFSYRTGRGRFTGCVCHSSFRLSYILELILMWWWMQLPRYIWEINPDIFSNPKYTYAHINYYTQGWYIWMQLMWFDFSNWILIAFSVERVRALFDPLSYRGPPAAKRARIVIGFVFVCAALSNMYRMVMQYYLMATRDIPTFLKDSVNAFITGAPNWLQTWNDVNMYYKDIEVIVVFLILLICNICIIRCIFRHRQKISFCPTITSTDRKRAGGSTVDFGCVNILLAAVTVPC
ncbi:uncharacterized protein LOC129601447 isoform X1 [Paramacrobiotus metropolitanus]|uniref:uncharacterized protein LOC129594220 isoform X1 n=1 Tax=Paramacrobiotus metropolitanus TaxID=2943436 RepID=UPI002445B66C|nr:uncharacterized protein LOC129594220 isoform X1 [Paramacrobiotus metropolitanus]XP_055356229.1 uncharacterized protein LOC129601447 isoform X1 [Paramacrobiotus metropolitanus]